MKYSLIDTIMIIAYRNKFDSKQALSHVHCCFSTLIYNEMKHKDSYQDPFANLVYLVINGDRLEININGNNAKKSLDFGFVITNVENSECSEEMESKCLVLGDLKLNKVSANNPYKDLMEKYNGSLQNFSLFNIEIFNKVYIVYPSNLVNEVREVAVNNRNRISIAEENNDLDKFTFVSIDELKNEFF